jgi:uncharacterized membrane protein YeiH
MELLLLLDIIGIIAFTLSGYILGAKAKLDILGIILLSGVTSFGGGFIRDIIVNRTPFIFSETYPLIIMSLTIGIAYLCKIHIHVHLTNNKVFQISDSLGLVVFAFTGASLAISQDYNIGGVLFLSLLTATGGGIIRDIILGQIPFIFKSEFYGMVSIIVGLLTWVISDYNLRNQTYSISILITGFIIRLYAIKYNWKLPHLIQTTDL